MYLLVGDDEHSSKENAKAQLKNKQWKWLMEFTADQKYLRFFLVSFASCKNEVENTYFGIHDNIQKMIKMDSQVWFILLFPPSSGM